MAADWWRIQDGHIRLTLYIQPGARKTEVAGEHGGALKIRLAAPPVEGKANAALTAWLAARFEVPQRQVVLRQGEMNRNKVFDVTGSKIDAETALLGR